ncbi:MAG TPA: ribonuclease PH [Thermoanaerobaculaceae bacterium]|nr:ribonuclease PH [Thermoanaerobaculaceae bacterium]
MVQTPVVARRDGRADNEPRPLQLTLDFVKYPEGSVLARAGDTVVVCNVTVEGRVPPFLRDTGEGWLTSEYAMLPRATEERTPRDSARGNVSGRSAEIQRLIGRSLRASLDMGLLGERTLVVDCDVLQADGGTRTTAITGAFVAVVLALLKLKSQRSLPGWPVRDQVAAVSVGITNGRSLLDLDYEEDSRAATDLNLVGTARRGIVEVQGTAEREPFSRAELDRLLDLAESGLQKAFATQRAVLEDRLEKVGVKALAGGPK